MLNEHTKAARHKLQLNTHSRGVHQSSNQSSLPEALTKRNEFISEKQYLVASVTTLLHAVIMLAAPRQPINPNDAAAVKILFNCLGNLHIMNVLGLEELVVCTFSAMGLVVQQMDGAHWCWRASFDALICEHNLGAPR